MTRKNLALLGFGLLGISGLFAADPAALLRYDFGTMKDGTIPDSALRGAPALKTVADICVKDGALETKSGLFKSNAPYLAEADAAALKQWLKGKDLGELSAAFWIRFDKIGAAEKASLGLVECGITEDGFLEAAFTADKKDLLGTRLVMKSKVKAEKGVWYHVEMSYSYNARRCNLYINGKFQFENDNLNLPVPAFNDLKIGGNFKGAVRDLRIYDAALQSEELAILDPAKADWETLKKTGEKAASLSKYSYLSSWIADLQKRMASYQKNIGITTVAQYKRLERDLKNTLTLAEGLSTGKATASEGFAVYSVPATTQELFLPYDLPDVGKLTNTLSLFMAKDEYETASLLIVPFREIKNFSLRLTDLRSGNNTLPASDIDVKIVKRWFRTGGAWMSYHVDFRMRTLTPDLLVNDDKIIRVDEFRRTNELLFHYPTGDHYADVSRWTFDREFMSAGERQFFYDAPTLQSLDLTEAGRNQQYLITFHVPKTAKEGLYTGKLEFTIGGKVCQAMDVKLKVLPFVLSEPLVYDTLKPYLSHINTQEYGEAGMTNAMKFNFMHIADIPNNMEMLKVAKKIGYPMKQIFAEYPRKIRSVYSSFGGPDSARTPAYEAQMDQMVLRPFQEVEQNVEKYLGIKDYELWVVYTSEASRYGAISVGPDRVSNMLHKYTHVKPFSHGMSEHLVSFSPGIYDMDSNVKAAREWAEIWHAADGRMISYAAPFPGPENPGLMRRVLGLEYYKKRMDGHMMHGYVDANYNEFSKFMSGDGDYRTFSLAFSAGSGLINRLAIVGCREGYDDVRYATTMKLQALKYLKSPEPLLAREAKRQLAWLERVDGDFFDLDSFRSGCAFRILALQDLAAKLEGKK